MVALATQLMRSGLGSRGEIADWIDRGEVRVDGLPGKADQVLEPGMAVDVRGGQFRVEKLNDRPRLWLSSASPQPVLRITGWHRVHAGLHKCLTMYIRSVLQRVAMERCGKSGCFRHFFHRADEFYRECGNYEFSSISGHAVDLDRFEDVRVSRFIRDPRDLLISGYFYHRRGAEHWANYKGPLPEEWAVIGAPVPERLGTGVSLSSYLNEVSVEEGLLTEIEFRRQHFDSMRRWPVDDFRVRCYRYEDILGNERAVFRDLLAFYELPSGERRKGARWAWRLRAKKRARQYRHIRDPRSGQWREHFTPAVAKRFDQEYGDLLELLGYV